MNQPTNLFKYLPPHDHAIGILQNRRIRFTPAAALNDPFELSAVFSSLGSRELLESSILSDLDHTLRKMYARLPAAHRAQESFEAFTARAMPLVRETLDETHRISPIAARAVSKMFPQQASTRLGILSLTEEPRSLLMWAHYADEHRGFVIGFDAGNAFFHQEKSIHDELRHLRQVSYSDTRPAMSMDDVTGVKVFLTKSTEWGYEKEWRMLLALEDCEATVPATPFDIHLFRFPGSAISQVVLGCRMEDSKRRAIIDALRRDADLAHVALLQAEPDENDYRLNLVDKT